MKDGDVNSKFFHSSSNSRKASNMIHCLEHDDDDIDFNKKKRNLMLLPLISIPYFKLATIILLIFQSLIIYLIVFLLTTMPLYWLLLLRKNLELHFSIWTLTSPLALMVWIQFFTKKFGTYVDMRSTILVLLGLKLAPSPLR